MALGTALSRLTGFLRIVALAYALGINHLSDAYNLANNTPNIVYDLVAGGVLSATLVPVFVEKRTAGTGEDADRAMSAVLTIAASVLIAASVVLLVLAPTVIDLYTVGSHAPGIAGTRSAAVSLLRWFAPQVLLYGMCTLATAVLNARKVFAPPMFVPVLNNLVSIFMLVAVAIAFHHPSLITSQRHHSLIVLLGAGTTAGVLVQAVALVPSLRRCGAHLRWTWAPRHPAVRQVVALSGWTFGFVMANQLAYFVVLALATHIGTGAPTAYTYAYTFFQLPYGIVAVSVMTAVQPDLAEAWIHRNLAAFRQRLARAFTSIMAVVVPAAAGLLALSGPVVALVLGHGAANPAATLPTSGALAMLALGLPGFCAFLLLMRAFQAMQDTRSVFRLYLWENGVNVITALALYRPMGVKGLALSMSIAYSVASLIAAAQVALPLGGLDGWRVVRPVIRVVVLSVSTGGVAFLVQRAIGSDSGIGLLVRVATAVGAGVSFFLVGSVGAVMARERNRTPRGPSEGR